jgi:hypothetical protein
MKGRKTVKKSSSKIIDAMKKVSREQRLAREAMVGRPRSSSWGGRPSPDEVRRNWRKSEDF